MTARKVIRRVNNSIYAPVTRNPIVLKDPVTFDIAVWGEFISKRQSFASAIS